LRALGARRAPHVLDPLRARPPARDRVGIRDEVPDTLDRRGDHPLARDPRHGREPYRLLRGGLQAPEIADEEQVLQVAADPRQALEVLERLLAPRLAARAEPRADELLEQRRLAVGGRAEYAEVAGGDAEPGELGRGAHDLEVGLVVDGPPVAPLR